MGVLRQRRSVGRTEKRPRHPEVHQERTTRLEPNNQILAATIDQGDPFAVELSRHLDRFERTRQPRIVDADVLEDPALEHRRKPSADGLDLGQLRHRRTVAVAL